MSTREYAAELVGALNEEQIINFIKSFADRATVAKLESLQLANDPAPRTYSCFREFMDEVEMSEDE